MTEGDPLIDGESVAYEDTLTEILADPVIEAVDETDTVGDNEDRGDEVNDD